MYDLLYTVTTLAKGSTGNVGFAEYTKHARQKYSTLTVEDKKRIITEAPKTKILKKMLREGEKIFKKIENLVSHLHVD